IFEVRREIGALIAARAAAGRPDTGRLHELVDSVRTAATPGQAQTAECEIHRMLAAATGNRVYGLLVNSLLNAYLEVGHLFQAPLRCRAEADGRLAPLVAAVCDGDRARARIEADRYLAETERLMLG